MYPYLWTEYTTSASAPEDGPGVGSGRTAACLYSTTTSSFTVSLDLNDGATHDLELYFLDWGNSGRSESVTISNAYTGAVLDTETVSSFTSGALS